MSADLTAHRPPRVLGPDEPRGITRILELQAVDTATDRLHTRRDLLESGEELRAARQGQIESEQALGEVRLELDDAARAQRKLEGDIEMIGQRIAAEERRLYDGSVADPRELQSIQAEVAGLRERTARMEDEALEIMERREALEARAATLQAQADAARQAVDEARGDAAQELEQIEGALSSLESERAGLLPGFDEGLLALYEDIRRQRKGVGAAALSEGVCGGCRQKLSAVELDRLKRASGVRRCDSCRRILVFV